MAGPRSSLSCSNNTRVFDQKRHFGAWRTVHEKGMPDDRESSTSGHTTPQVVSISADRLIAQTEDGLNEQQIEDPKRRKQRHLECTQRQCRARCDAETVVPDGNHGGNERDRRHRDEHARTEP